MLYRSRANRERRRATSKRADAEAIQIKCMQREDNVDNKEIGCRGCPDNAGPESGRRTTVERADAEAIRIAKGPKSGRKTTIERVDAGAIRITKDQLWNEDDNRERAEADAIRITKDKGVEGGRHQRERMQRLDG